jgi:hypothetical protein
VVDAEKGESEMNIIKNSAIAFATLLAISCADAEGAKRVLEKSGYKNIRTTGWEALTCSRDDETCTGFEATAPNGEAVTGSVGGSFFGCKGHTIRLD